MDVYSRVDYSFEYLRQDLGKFYMEAKDNVRFLTTLERHFKNVTYGASFQSVRHAGSHNYWVVQNVGCRSQNTGSNRLYGYIYL